MEFYGDRAYAKGRNEMHATRTHGNRRQAEFFAKVSLEIAKRTEIQIVLDTATRYLEDQTSYVRVGICPQIWNASLNLSRSEV